MFEIEWDANHDQHSRRRNPYRSKASTIHGWVTKLRGTLLDNEAVRRQGIREMKDAKHLREYRKQRKAHDRSRGGSHRGFLSFFTSSKTLKKRRDPSHNSRAVVVHRDSSRHHRSHKGHHNTRLRHR
ncbi:hypothetical protein QCA50_000401 [Cerrena zonata]|uniref:Uncharacterized protein n=1 Tax=Cerrena zonata TaxID=2478898 RepID=A0AAW0GWM8_9APHY